MVIYDLKCVLGHQFEGWFQSVASFDDQLAAEMVACTVCGTTEVVRIPSGGHTSLLKAPKRKKRCSKEKVINAEPATSIPDVQDLVAKENHHQMADKVLNVDPVILMKAVHQYVKSNFKDVGKTFTDKAIKMQKGKIPEEPIYGEASNDQLDKLDEEGIAFSVLPNLSEEFNN